MAEKVGGQYEAIPDTLAQGIHLDTPEQWVSTLEAALGGLIEDDLKSP